MVGQAAPPSFRATLREGMDPAAQVTHALYSGIYRLIEAAPARVSPQLAPARARVLRGACGAMPSPAANDGIVPTLSQAWGRVIHAAVADHLDVLGHFRDAAHSPPHDWLVSGATSTAPASKRPGPTLWADVARFLVLEAARQPKRGRAGGRPQVKKATSRKKTPRR